LPRSIPPLSHLSPSTSLHIFRLFPPSRRRPSQDAATGLSREHWKNLLMRIRATVFFPHTYAFIDSCIPRRAHLFFASATFLLPAVRSSESRGRIHVGTLVLPISPPPFFTASFCTSLFTFRRIRAESPFTIREVSLALSFFFVAVGRFYLSYTTSASRRPCHQSAESSTTGEKPASEFGLCCLSPLL